MATWSPRTYDDEARARLPQTLRADRLDWTRSELQALASDPDPVIALPQRVGEGQAETVVKCPGCGVWSPPWSLVDVRALPATLTGGHAWACSGCWETWINTGKISRRDFLRGLGAPTATLIAMGL